ncbi:hypothetical protein X975_22748, partial [Stegodyphus mimosarum]
MARMFLKVLHMQNLQWVLYGGENPCLCGWTRGAMNTRLRKLSTSDPSVFNSILTANTTKGTKIVSSSMYGHR